MSSPSWEDEFPLRKDPEKYDKEVNEYQPRTDNPHNSVVDEVDLDLFLSDFYAEEFREMELEEELHKAQLDIEGEFHEKGNLFIYGFIDNSMTLVAAASKPREDLYLDEEYMESSAEHMIPLWGEGDNGGFIRNTSKNYEEIDEISDHPSFGIPEGLKNRAERVVDTTELNQHDLSDVETMYLLPVLSEQEYNSI